MIEYLILLLPALLLIAAFCDIRTMLIPDWISIAIAIGFLPVALMAELSLTEIGVQYSVGLAVFLLGAMLFAANLLGGGDVKLISAATIWFGWPLSLKFYVGFAIFGGVLALLVLVVRHLGVFETGPKWLVRKTEATTKEIDETETTAEAGVVQPIGVPYAIAIAAGALYATPNLMMVL